MWCCCGSATCPCKHPHPDLYPNPWTAYVVSGNNQNTHICFSYQYIDLIERILVMVGRQRPLNWFPFSICVSGKHTSAIFSTIQTLSGLIKFYFFWLNKKNEENLSMNTLVSDLENCVPVHASMCTCVCVKYWSMSESVCVCVGLMCTFYICARIHLGQNEWRVSPLMVSKEPFQTPRDSFSQEEDPLRIIPH